MSNLMDGCWAKIERANEHIGYLAAELQRYADTNTDRYRLITDIHRDTGLCIVKIFDNNPSHVVPTRLAVIAGEILHHLRSSLDHLVWALVLCKHPAPEFRVAFPVCETSAKYEKALREGIMKGVTGRSIALIKSVQPYHESEPRKSPLFVLHQLNNTEKHRLLLVAFAAVAQPHKIGIDPGKGDITFGLPDPKVIKPFTRPTKDGTEFFRYTLDRIDDTVKVNLEVSCQIVLDEGQVGELQPIIPRLAQLRDATVKVLDLFRGEF